MTTKLASGLLLAVLLAGCASSDNSPSGKVDYTTDPGRAMPEQTYWWEVKK